MIVDVFVGLLWIGLLLIAGKLVRRFATFLDALYLPTSVVAGALALLVGPQVLGAVAGALGVQGFVTDGLIPADVLEVWTGLPGLLISVVFAALFLGKRIPSPREIWRHAGPQVALGQTMAWGQYVVGILLAVTVLSPVFGLPPAAGALIEIGLEGGHGTAAGLAPTFEAFDFPEGADLALGLATIGIVAGVLIGTVMVNWAARTGRIDPAMASQPPRTGESSRENLADLDEREPSTSPTGADPLSVHLGLVSVAVGVGWLLQQALIALENATWARDGGLELLQHIPLFPLAMIGGVIVQLVLDHTRVYTVDRGLMTRISGASLDIIIVAALGTLSVQALGGNLAPFALLAVAGLVWNVTAYLVIAPRVIPSHPYERGLADFGQSTGMTVTGLLLMRMADPFNRSGGMESFGYKQLLFEPVVGGGLFTAASIPLIAQAGPWWVLGIASVLTVGFLVLGLRMFGPEARTG